MKLVLIKNKGCKGTPHWNLVLETKDEILTYLEKHNDIQAEEMYEYLGNREVNHKEDSGTARYLDMYVTKQQVGRPIFFPELAQSIDALNSKKYLQMAKLLDLGNVIRANKSGGYSTFSENIYTVYQSVEIDIGIFIKYMFYEKYKQFFTYLHNKNRTILKIENPNYNAINITFKGSQLPGNIAEIAEKYFNIHQKLNFSMNIKVRFLPPKPHVIPPIDLDY